MNTRGSLVAAIALGVAMVIAGCSTTRGAPEHRGADAAAAAIIIHQERSFDAPPERVYGALLDSKEFSAFSGRPAEIDQNVGGAFSLFGGHIVGRNLELVPNRRIVQAWRVVTWPEGAYSIARFELTPRESGTRLVFDHIGFPEGLHDHLAEGWETNYWSLLVKYFR